MHDPEQITVFAETDARNRRVRFGIKAKDRTRHVYVIGKTGMGKSVLLENMAVQDILNGNGFAFMDPHGKSADLLLEYVPKERIKDVIYFAPFDMEHPISFNVLEDVGYDKRHLVVSGLMSTFKKIWEDAWSARMEYILSNTILALLEYPGATLLHVNKMLSDKKFREDVVSKVTDPGVKSFWVDEFAKYTDRFAAEATPAIQNKIGQFTSNPLIRNIIGQPTSSFDIRQVMDERKILIINLSKGRIGEQNANLLGSMLITKIYLAALSRADMNEYELEKLPNFYLFVDEFQSFANDSFADILSEARKYKLNLTIAHQYIEQMSETVRAAVFGNVGTLISFRVGPFDAEILEKEFAPIFTAEDIVNLGFTQIYLRLMINGIGSQPFSAKTIGPWPKGEVNYVKDIIDSSRAQFTRSRADAEAGVAAVHLFKGENKPNNKSGEQNNNGKNSNGAGGRNGNGNNGGGNNKNGGDSRNNNGHNNSQAKKIDPVFNSKSDPARNSVSVNDSAPTPPPKKMISEEKRKEIEKFLQSKREAMDKLLEETEGEDDQVLPIPKKEIKLDELPPRPKTDDKGPSEKNKNALRETLMQVTNGKIINLPNIAKDQSEEKKDVSQKPASRQNQPQQQNFSQNQTQPAQNTPPEIPEDKLREMLEE